MDARAEFQLQTDVNRTLIEAGLNPSQTDDPVAALRRLEQLGSRGTTDILRQLRQRGRA